MKEKIDWKRKLTSRKFWMAVVGFVTPIMTLAQVPENGKNKTTPPTRRGCVGRKKGRYDL